jgi:CII-binding regulator of phage lambda lysogenization HflD
MTSCIKKLYQEVARSMHPDLTTDEKARIYRHQMMAEANCAYEEGNEDRLREILEQWESSSEAVEGEGTGAELIRVIRKIAQVEARLRAIDAEMAELKASDLWQLKEKVEEAENKKRDLLSEMATVIESKIAEAKQSLYNLNIQSGEKA